MRDIYIALGANLSNPKQTFIEALDKLRSEDVEILNVSGLWKSPSWPPGQGHPDYLNAVAKISFKGTPAKLLQTLNDLEESFGRERQERNAPRPLDLDIVSFGQRILDSETLTIPHPRMFTRGFVLLPLEQVAPNWRDPHSKNDLQYYIARLPLQDVEAMKYIGTFYQCN